MPEKFDFERAWLAKFSSRLDDIAGKEIRVKVMQGSEGLSSDSSRGEVIAWSRMAMERLESLVDEEGRKSIMTGCACHYPRSGLQDVRKEYEATQDIDIAHRMLQERFESFLSDTLELDDDLVAKVVGRGWGLAGIRQDGTIIATKIPKSGYLVQYMQETDPEKKRQVYCHCPRVRDALKTGVTISPTYCYCGAGFYKGIWEEILQEPVEVEVLKSVLKGDQVCTIAVHLPHHLVQ
jgi:predicted hydrocarbon binding protein